MGRISINVVCLLKDLLVFHKIARDAVKNSLEERKITCRNGKKKGDDVCIEACNRLG